MISPTLNVPQARFLSMPHKFKAYVAGFGSGKTWIGCGGICKGIWEHPGINQGYFAPTYPQIRDIFYPTVEEVAADWGLNVKINEGNKEVHFYYGRQYRGTTICRSMEKPQTIVGFKIGNALVDELDILPKEKARTAWRKIIARMRYQKWNGTAWVKDTEAEKLFRIREAEETKNNLMQVASEHIAPLQDAADLEIATEEEISLLEAWKKYRVLLNRVDTSTAQDIEWPALP